MQNFCGQARFPSGPWRNICLITHPMPKWRNGRRRGFKIPRLHGRESSNLSLGTHFSAFTTSCYPLNLNFLLASSDLVASQKMSQKFCLCLVLQPSLACLNRSSCVCYLSDRFCIMSDRLFRLASDCAYCIIV